MSRQRPEIREEPQQARAAAATFQAFIDAHPEEQAWLSEWAAVDLAAPPPEDSRSDHSQSTLR